MLFTHQTGSNLMRKSSVNGILNYTQGKDTTLWISIHQHCWVIWAWSGFEGTLNTPPTKLVMVMVKSKLLHSPSLNWQSASWNVTLSLDHYGLLGTIMINDEVTIHHKVACANCRPSSPPYNPCSIIVSLKSTRNCPLPA